MRFKGLSFIISLLAVLVLSSWTLAAANVIYSDSFEKDLSKWTAAPDRVPVTSEAKIYKGLAHSGDNSLQFFCAEGPAGGGVNILLPDFNLKTGYVEAWLYDSTGDRSAWVDQAYLVVSGPGYEGAGAWVQLGLDGKPDRSEDQTLYTVYIEGPGWITTTAKRSKGWHKFGFELKPGGEVAVYIDGTLQAEHQSDAWEKIAMVGFLSYYGADRDGAEGEPLRESFWDDLVVYDKRP